MWWDYNPADISPVYLDPKIRDWVLIPIFVVMFLQGVLRHYVGLLLIGDAPSVNVDALQRAELMKRSARLRGNGMFLPPASVRMRKRFLINQAFKEKPKVEGDTPQMPQMPAQDPGQMVGMLKQNMAMIVPNMLMMGWVSYFFSGFVLVKLPFPLTDRFKDMLQRGINLKSLDPSYVSSLSWYFINLFGLRGLFSLVLGANSATDDAAMMQQQMAGANAMQQMDPDKVFAGERTELEIMEEEFLVSDAEYRILGRVPPAPHR